MVRVSGRARRRASTAAGVRVRSWTESCRLGSICPRFGCWLFAQHEALDAVGFAGVWIAADYYGAHFGVAGGGFEFAGHACEKAVEDHLFFDANDGVIR